MTVNGNNRKQLADINVTPLVDVMLVLLIIFMVTAPMMKTGLVMDLPEAKSSQIPVTAEPLVISVSKKGIFVDNTPVTFGDVGVVTKNVLMHRADDSVVIEAEKDIPFEYVVKILGELRALGIVKVGIATKPEGRST
ncbi:MAG: ExbD/TolR family protein [Thermosulfidibacteraceae bacterium]|jgi:biopolymer transport protein TolR